MKNFIVLLLALTALKTQAFVVSDIYKSGRELCKERESERAGEFFKWIAVPIDYAHPEKGHTEVYAYTKKAFNPNAPTLLFFTGGPGVSSRSTEFSLPHFNVLFFEQRGISCSKPKTKELFLSPSFYSSENTAADALEVLKAFHIKRASVFGHSYGTIPATIFASKYPDYTRSLILEGVVYHADQSLWLAKKRDQLLQDLFDSLTVEEKNFIVELSSSGKVPSSWFSKIGQMMLYLNDGVESYRQFLKSIISNDSMDRASFINNFFPDPLKPEEDFSFGDVTMGMIACREMSMSDPKLSLTTIFKDGQLVADENNIDRVSQCQPLALQDAYQTATSYKAEKYPIHVPVNYLLGETDGATPLDHGLNHYENVARGPKQLLVMTKGGHLPSLGLLKENRDCEDCDNLKQNKIQAQIFENLALGLSIEQSLIEEFNNAGELKWNVN